MSARGTRDISRQAGMSRSLGPFADSRTVQESNGGYTVSILKEIAERYDLEQGD